MAPLSSLGAAVSHCSSDTAELARKAALFSEGAKRIYEARGADMWFFELWHFLDDVQEELTRAAAAQAWQQPLGFETVTIPKMALDWLNGEGPDHDGIWFSEWFSDGPLPENSRGRYWWRSKFRELCAASSTVRGEGK